MFEQSASTGDGAVVFVCQCFNRLLLQLGTSTDMCVGIEYLCARQ